MQVKWLRKALRNLDEEASYIASDDAKAARLVVERVVGAVALELPKSSPRHPYSQCSFSGFDTLHTGGDRSMLR